MLGSISGWKSTYGDMLLERCYWKARLLFGDYAIEVNSVTFDVFISKGFNDFLSLPSLKLSITSSTACASYSWRRIRLRTARIMKKINIKITNATTTATNISQSFNLPRLSFSSKVFFFASFFAYASLSAYSNESVNFFYCWYCVSMSTLPVKLSGTSSGICSVTLK